MPDSAPLSETETDAPGITWRVKLVVALLVVLAVAVVLGTNRWLSERFTEVTRNRAELRLALYSGNMISELQRNSVVPLLLARDPELIGALERKEYSSTSARLTCPMQTARSGSSARRARARAMASTSAAGTIRPVRPCATSSTLPPTPVAKIGKPVGSDADNDKTTFITLYGLQGAHEEAERHNAAALAALDALGPGADFLRLMAAELLERKK